MRKHKKIKFRQSNNNKKINYTWILGITLATFLIAFFLGYFSKILEKVHPVLAFLILLFIVLIGIFFDGLGIAVTAAEERPFHSMASKKVNGAKESILIIRNAGLVANFFNDVIGDISGIISGSAAIAIVLRINTQTTFGGLFIDLSMTAFIASITVGGKAIGKEIAIRNANSIVYRIGLIIYYMNIKRILKK